MVCEQLSTRRVVLGTALILILAVIAIICVINVQRDEKNENSLREDESSAERVARLLNEFPIIDAHNAFPFNLRQLLYNDLRKVNFNSDLTQTEPWKSSNRSHTDLPRLKQGRVGVQFWLANTRCNSQYKDSVEQTLEQIDVIKRLVADYDEHFQWATSSSEIEKAIGNKKIASLIGVEGGHSIQSSFGILRILYEVGVRYMTLTNICNTPWADSEIENSVLNENSLSSENRGLSHFGLKIVDEMNRLGMMVDISHASYVTMKAALLNSKSPVIFSHSSIRALCNVTRNIPDDVLKLIKEKQALIMVNFNSKCHFGRNTTIDDIVDQLNYIKENASADNVGLGADFDGVTALPVGLEDVSKYPELFLKLVETGLWSDEDLKKLAGKNLLRVLRTTEKVRDSLKNQRPHEEMISQQELSTRRVDMSCSTANFP